METGTDLKLVRWANDGCPPIIMDNQYSEILKLINAYTSILKENTHLKEEYAALDSKAFNVFAENEHLKEQLLEAIEALKNIHNIEDAAFGLKGFDVKRLKSEISEIISKHKEQ